jgi:hypothetical protein
VIIPEIEFEVSHGSLGGRYISYSHLFMNRFTTVEGLLVGIKEDLQKSPFISGDSGQQGLRDKYQQFINSLETVIYVGN